MIEKITPAGVVLTVWVGYAYYTTTYDYRRYRLSTMPYIYPFSAYVRKMEESKLGRVYKFKEHLTKSMYERNAKV